MDFIIYLNCFKCVLSSHPAVKYLLCYPVSVIDDVQEHQLAPGKLEKENNNMYRIVGTINGHYMVETPKGLKKVKISGTDKININDEIQVEEI